MSSELSFFQSQMLEIGFDPEVDISQYSSHPDEPFGKKTPHPLFWEDPKTGNLHIGVMDLSGDLITHDTKDSHSRLHIKPISIQRLKKPLDDTKYISTSTGLGTYPYLTQTVINAFKKNETIKKLVVVEGFKKAFALAKKTGIPTIGIPGITQWKGKRDDEIYFAIKDVVQKCDVEEIIFLTDADTLEVKYREGKDLYKRPFSFYTACKIYRELTKDFGIDCYLAHIKTEFVDKAKGIDDLLCYLGEMYNDQIKKEIINASGSKMYIAKTLISGISIQKLKEYFYIADPYNAKKFYYRYESEIGTNPFTYNNSVFLYDDNISDLVCIKSAASSQFIMIQDTFFMKGAKPTIKDKVFENVLLPVSEKAILIMNKNDKKKVEKIKSEMEYYHGAFNLPSHTDFEFVKETEDVMGNKMRWYNRYKPITHVPKEGDYSTSMEMVRHIFGTNTIRHDGKEFKEYELGLDYIQILWNHPTFILPIVVLASNERKTGKTTFWNWMREIFQQNSRKVEGDELSAQFTSYYVNSLLIVIEEAFFEKKQTIERIKELVTANRGKMESKGKDAMEVDTFLKAGISTNNVNNFAKIDLEETRFWIRKVNPFEKEQFEMLEKLIEEIPAFLWFLQERTLVTKRESRAWFNEALIETQELKNVKSESRWGFEINLENSLKEYMTQVKKGYVRLCQKDFKEIILDNQNFDKGLLRKVLEHNWKMLPTHGSVYYTRFEYRQPDEMNPEGHVVKSKRSSIVYSFLIDQFFDPSAYLEFITDYDDLKELEEKQIEKKMKSFFNRISLEQRLTLGRKIYSHVTDDYMKKILSEVKEVKTGETITKEFVINSYKSFYDAVNSFHPFN